MGDLFFDIAPAFSATLRFLSCTRPTFNTIPSEDNFAICGVLLHEKRANNPQMKNSPVTTRRKKTSLKASLVRY